MNNKLLRIENVRVGDRVSNPSEGYQGVVTQVREYDFTVRRDDGVKGGGYRCDWVVGETTARTMELIGSNLDEEMMKEKVEGEQVYKGAVKSKKVNSFMSRVIDIFKTKEQKLLEKYVFNDEGQVRWTSSPVVQEVFVSAFKEQLVKVAERLEKEEAKKAR